MILDNCYTGLPKSQYSPDMKMVFEKYPIRPYRMCEDKDVKDYTSIDQHRCYTSILQNNGEPWNVFGGFDYIRPYLFVSEDNLIPGEYYIAKDFYMGRGSIFISKGFYPMAFVKHALRRNFIDGADLTHAIFANQHLKADTFKKFADDLYEQYPDESKCLINFTIGCFAALYHRDTIAGVTTDFDTAMATMVTTENVALYEIDNVSMDDHMKRLFIIQQNKEFMKDAGDMPLYRQVIAASIVELDKMVEALKPERIIAYNTDSIKVAGDYDYSVTKPKQDCRKPGEYHIEEEKPLVGKPIAMLDRNEEYKWEATHARHASEEDMNMDQLLDGALVLGMPGCGKSELIVSLWNKMTPEQRKRTVVTSYTNASVENLKNRKVEAQTLSSLLWNGTNMSVAALEKYERIVLDEFSMLPPYEMGLLLNASIRFGIKVICVGDQNQCKAPVDNWVRYDTNPLFLKMCGQYVVTMKYKPGFARYDEALYASLMSFLKDRVLTDWTCSEVESYKNICFSNDKRRIVNKLCLSRWVKEHNAKLIDFGFPVCVGLPVMAYDDADKDLGIYKTQTWEVKAITKDKIYLLRNGVEVYLNKSQFKSIFNYAFAMTCQKAQGITIDGHYNIYEAQRMSADVLYTAMSRGTKREFVHIVSKRGGRYYESSRADSVLVRHEPIKMKTARIYRIDLGDGGVYIGKTTKTLEERFAEHKLSPTNDDMALALDDRATIRLVEEFQYKEERRLRDAEQAHIARAVTKGLKVLNVQHNVVKETLPTKPLKPAVKPKIAVGENVSKRRYEVQLRRRNVEKDEQVKRFPWGDNKEKARRMAEQWREYLLKKYF